MNNNSINFSSLNIIHRNQEHSGVSPVYRSLILWPCLAWSIVVPVRAKSGLDLFARLVLELAALGVIPKSEGYPVPLHKDLLATIVRNLQNEEYLDSAMLLGIRGKELLKKEQQTKEEYANATVLTDRTTGKLIPFIMSGSFPYCTAVRKEKDKVCYKISPIDKHETRARIFYHQTVKADSPQPVAVLRAYKEHLRRHKQFALYGGVSTEPPTLVESGAISVSPLPEKVYLACTVLIPDNNVSELLVTDGLGLGFSSSFANTLQKANPDWLESEKQQYNGSVHSFEPDKSELPKDLRYPQVTDLCQRAFLDLATFEGTEIDSKVAEDVSSSSLNNLICHAYDALEKAFAHVVANSRIDELVELLNYQTEQEKMIFLTETSRKLGLDTSPAESLFRYLPPGKLEAVRGGAAEMLPLLALNIAATEVDANHPMVRLAQQQPGLLSWIARFTRMRNAAKHSGKIPLQLLTDPTDSVTFKKNVRSIPEQAAQIICELLPDIEQELRPATMNDKKPSPQNAKQQALDIQLLLERYFSCPFLREVPKELLHSMQTMAEAHLAVKRTPTDSIWKNSLLVRISSTLEQTLSFINRNLYRPEASANAEAAVQRMVDTEFFSTNEEVNLGVLGGYNEKRLQNGMKGSHATLGPLTLALFLQAEQAQLQALHNSQPDAISLIMNLIQKRRHGNAGACTDFIEPKDVDSYYQLCKSFISIFIIK